MGIPDGIDTDPPSTHVSDDAALDAWLDASIARRASRRPVGVRRGKAIVIAAADPASPPSPATIVLGKIQGGFRHVGSVGVRGPAAPAAVEWERAGFSPVEAEAARFVASWFGQPYDAVTSPRQGGLCFGVWRFDGPGIARVFRHWSASDPDGFIEATRGHKVEVRVTGSGASILIDGDADANAWLQDPRIISSLAGFGRISANQRSQLSVVHDRFLRPLLEAKRDDGSTIGDALSPTGVRERAVLFALQARHGTPRTVHLVRRALRRGSLVDALAASLREGGRNADANLVLWVQNSPELETT
jgi:hypothetical protein